MKFLRFLVALCLCFFTFTALATSYTWSGKGGDKLWANPLNWLPTNGPPTSGDSVTLDSTQVELDSALTLASANITDTTLTGAGALTVTAQSSFAYVTFQISSVTINAPTDINPSGGADVETAISCPLVNSSTITVHSNAEFIVNTGFTAINHGTWIFTPSATLSLPTGSTQISFLNTGSLYLTNATINGAQGASSSILSNASGGLVFSARTNTLNGVMASAGTIQTASNSVFLAANDSALNLYSGAVITGPGVTFINASASFNGNILVTGGLQFESDGANTITTITINGLLEIGQNGLFNWYGGSLAGVGTNVTGTIQVDLQGALYILNDQNGMSLKNVVLTNNGFIYWTNSGSLYLANNAVIANHLTFYISGDSALRPLPGDTSTVFFTNSSLVIKNYGAGSGGQTAIYLPFYDNGTVEISQGNFQLYNGGSVNNWMVNSGGTLTFESGTFTVQPNAAFSSGGPISLNSGAFINIPQYSILTVAVNFFHSGGIFGAGRIIISGGLSPGVYQWNAGFISITNQSDAVLIAPGGIMNIEGANNAKVLACGILVNTGIINWTNDNSVGGITLSNQAGIVNSAQFNLQCDAYMSDASTNASGASLFLNNAGALVSKTANSGVTTILVKFTDAGTIRAQTGTIELANFSDNYPNPPLPVIILVGGKVQFDSNIVVHANISGTGQITAQKPLTFSGGTMTVAAITLNGNITNDETIDLSSFGILTLNNGPFTQTANGLLIVPVQSTNAGGYGKVAGASATVYLGGSLRGTLDYGGAPAVGTSFTFLTCNQLFNTFSNVSLAEGMTVAYTANSASIVVTNVVPAVLAAYSLNATNIGITFATVTNVGYIIDYAPNFPPTWSSLTNFTAETTNEVFNIPITNSQGFFRIRASSGH
ncbi:MAG TPA: hypothetical protein VFC44_12200 [Candidatus Saccharimonadales bacterium]|nr:hypothetical protein [Candidatus Saccharimonadales bacterium]